MFKAWAISIVPATNPEEDWDTVVGTVTALEINVVINTIRNLTDNSDIVDIFMSKQHNINKEHCVTNTEYYIFIV